MTEHVELRRLAALAHPDAEWFIARNLDQPNIDKPAASFIAAATPKTVLALLDEIDRLKAENDALLLGMRAILNAYDYADQYNKEGVAVEVMEDLRTLFKGATQ
ncbi:TPA: ead/Ea22-like family protein [Pseudomonas aeruginosa]|nr:ead/Ea22-like family protein [Pseudomonas aeruginosa]